MIIAIDAAATDLSLALADADGMPLGDDVWTSPRRQSAELLPRLMALLERHGRTLPDASGVAVGTGPGSFTGLRVAMALGKGLAFALRIPIVGVPSLAAWLDSQPDATAAIARAGAHEAYVQLRGEPEPAIAEEAMLVERIGERRVVAPGELAGAFGLPNAVAPRAAAAIARRASERLTSDATGDDLHRLEPRYLRAPRGAEAVSDEPGSVRWL